MVMAGRRWSYSWRPTEVANRGFSLRRVSQLRSKSACRRFTSSAARAGIERRMSTAKMQNRFMGAHCRPGDAFKNSHHTARPRDASLLSLLRLCDPHQRDGDVMQGVNHAHFERARRVAGRTAARVARTSSAAVMVVQGMPTGAGVFQELHVHLRSEGKHIATW